MAEQETDEWELFETEARIFEEDIPAERLPEWGAKLSKASLRLCEMEAEEAIAKAEAEEARSAERSRAKGAKATIDTQKELVYQLAKERKLGKASVRCEVRTERCHRTSEGRSVRADTGEVLEAWTLKPGELEHWEQSAIPGSNPPAKPGSELEVRALELGQMADRLGGKPGEG